MVRCAVFLGTALGNLGVLNLPGFSKALFAKYREGLHLTLDKVNR